MASTANAIPASNHASGNANTPSTTPSNAAARPSLKTTSGAKGSDGSRKQTGSPVDGAQRRNIPQKAWTLGPNPITQKAPQPQQNGNIQAQKSTASQKGMAPKESNTADKHAHDRLTFLLANFIGLNTIVTVKSGETFSGIFSSSSLESSDTSFLLKMAQRVSLPEDTHTNGVVEHTSFLGAAPDHELMLELKDIGDIMVKDVTTQDFASKGQNGVSSGFRTDADIAGSGNGRERTLQRWDAPAGTGVDLSLDSNDMSSFDQFQVNEKMTGKKSTYDENLYTTRIDRSAPSYKQREAEATRIAREIEAQASNNAHIREERGQALESDGLDEEERYSGVRRDDFPPLQSGQANKYTPPARRAPTGQATVRGAPVDPAIISAQLARPGSTQNTPGATSQTEQSTTETAALNTAGAAPAPAAPAATTNAPGKTISEAEKLPTPSKPSALNTSVSPSRRAGGAESTTGNVENVGVEVLQQFRDFAAQERNKLQQSRRAQANQDRTMKLNELLKFSKNFKLNTPVPKDLIPILAKDPVKQEEIIDKAQRQSEEKPTSSTPPGTHSTTGDPKSAPRATTSGRYDVGAVPPAGADRHNYPRGRQGYPPSGPQMGSKMQSQTMHPQRGQTGFLSNRLQGIQQERKAGMPMTIPTPLPIHDGHSSVDQSGVSSPQRQSAIQTPTSAVSSKFNVKALEFRPNPGASTFTPAGTSNTPSSPQSNARTRSVSRAPSPAIFFGPRKSLPSPERPSIKTTFDPIRRMVQEAKDNNKTQDYISNGGIPQAYRTPPVWNELDDQEGKSYVEMFEKKSAPAPTPSPQSRSTSNPQIPHQHQLPYHLQHGAPNVPQVHTPHQGPHHVHPQPHHPGGPGHFDDHHRMQYSASSSQVYPSPRLHQSPMAYPSPMGPHAQLAYGGQPMPQFFAPQGGPSPIHMRQYHPGQQFINPQNGQMAAPVMVQQPSSGPYMGIPQGMGPPYNNPQMQMYSPNPGHAYPQHMAPQQPHSGYPSPSRGAPMMMHQGSQQGQHNQPMMHMYPAMQPQHNQQGAVYPGPQPGHMQQMRGYPQQQPHFSSSPHQAHHFPHQQQRMPSNNYGQMQQMPQQPMPAQPPPPPAAPAAHNAEGVDEVK